MKQELQKLYERHGEKYSWQFDYIAYLIGVELESSSPVIKDEYAYERFVAIANKPVKDFTLQDVDFVRHIESKQKSNLYPDIQFLIERGYGFVSPSYQFVPNDKALWDKAIGKPLDWQIWLRDKSWWNSQNLGYLLKSYKTTQELEKLGFDEDDINFTKFAVMFEPYEIDIILEFVREHNFFQIQNGKTAANITVAGESSQGAVERLNLVLKNTSHNSKARGFVEKAIRLLKKDSQKVVEPTVEPTVETVSTPENNLWHYDEKNSFKNVLEKPDNQVLKEIQVTKMLKDSFPSDLRDIYMDWEDFPQNFSADTVYSIIDWLEKNRNKRRNRDDKYVVLSGENSNFTFAMWKNAINKNRTYKEIYDTYSRLINALAKYFRYKGAVEPTVEPTVEPKTEPTSDAWSKLVEYANQGNVTKINGILYYKNINEGYNLILNTFDTNRYKLTAIAKDVYDKLKAGHSLSFKQNYVLVHEFIRLVQLLDEQPKTVEPTVEPKIVTGNEENWWARDSQRYTSDADKKVQIEATAILKKYGQVKEEWIDEYWNKPILHPMNVLKLHEFAKYSKFLNITAKGNVILVGGENSNQERLRLSMSKSYHKKIISLLEKLILAITNPDSINKKPATKKKAKTEEEENKTEHEPIIYNVEAPKDAKRISITEGGELIPKPTEYIKAGQYEISDEQLLGVNLMLTAYNNGKQGFLLADDTGFGKTRQILLTAQEIRKASGRNVLIATENDNIIKKNFGKDIKALNIDTRGIDMVTYHSIADGKLEGKSYEAILFDEAHNLKNFDSKKTIFAKKIPAKFKIFATATPMDTITSSMYFIHYVTGLPEEAVLNRLGMKTTYRKHPTNKDEQIKVAVLDKNASYELVKHNLVNLRKQMVTDGTFLRRTFGFYGSIKTVNLGRLANSMDINRVDEYWTNAIKSVRGDSDEAKARRKALGMKKAIELTKITEYSKTSEIIKLAKQEVNAGRKVVIIAELVQDYSVEALENLIHKSLIYKVTKALEAEGISVARGYGSGQKKTDEIEKFQSGNHQVIVGTPKSLSTGLDLDDQVGNEPRTLIMVTPNYSGNIFQQVIGRVSRRNTKSLAKLLIITSVHTNDHRRMEIISEKLDTLKAIQQGKTNVDMTYEEDFGIKMAFGLQEDDVNLSGLSDQMGFEFGYEVLPDGAIVIENEKYSKGLSDNMKRNSNSIRFGKNMKSNTTYYARQADDIHSDLKRNWSSWNFGEEGFKITFEKFVEFLDSDWESFFISGFQIWKDDDFSFVVDDDFIRMYNGSEEWVFGELKPNYWVAVDIVHGGIGSLAGVKLKSKDLESAIKELDNIGFFGDGDWFDANKAKLVYSEGVLHILEITDDEIEYPTKSYNRLSDSKTNGNVAMRTNIHAELTRLYNLHGRKLEWQFLLMSEILKVKLKLDEAITLVKGRKSMIDVVGDKPVKHNWAVAELDTLIQSNDPFTFAYNTKYPDVKNTQTRDYIQDPAERTKVELYSGEKFNPEHLLNNTPESSSGTPIIVPTGVVLSGNGRTMILKRVAEVNKPKYEEYKALLFKLLDFAGIDKEKINQFKKPVLVRLIDVNENDYSKYSTLFNKSFTQAQDPIREGISIAKQLQGSPAFFNQIAAAIEDSGQDTWAKILSQAKPRKEIIETFRRYNVFNNTNENKYLTSFGHFNGSGQDFVKNVLLGYLIEEKPLIEAADGYTKQVVFAMTVLTKIETLPTEYRLAGYIKEVLKHEGARKSSGIRLVIDYLQQTRMLESGNSVGAVDISPEAIQLWRIMETTKTRELKDFANTYFQYYQNAVQSDDVFGGETIPVTAFLAQYQKSKRILFENEKPPKEWKTDETTLNDMISDIININYREMITEQANFLFNRKVDVSFTDKNIFVIGTRSKKVYGNIAIAGKKLKVIKGQLDLITGNDETARYNRATDLLKDFIDKLPKRKVFASRVEKIEPEPTEIEQEETLLGDEVQNIEMAETTQETNKKPTIRQVKLSYEMGLFFGKLYEPFKMLVWGKEGSGKSSYCLKLANELQTQGRVLYFMNEEKVEHGRLDRRLKLLEIKRKNIDFLDGGDTDTLISEIEKNNHKYIFIDSQNLLPKGFAMQLLDNYPDRNIVFISHSRKDSIDIKGDSMLSYMVDTKIKVADGYAVMEKHRDGKGTHNYSVFHKRRTVKFW